MISFMSMMPHIYGQATPGINNDITKNNKACKDSIRLKTLDGCKLRISKFNFDYNAQGGRGTGRRVKQLINPQHDQEHEMVVVSPVTRYEVDLKTVHIPPVTTVTAKVDGWAPFPPFVTVDVDPELLHGSICEESGKVEFKFRSKLWISIGSNYKAPPLLVDTVLTSEESKGAIFRRTLGKRLCKDGKCKLVGVAWVGPTDDPYINSVLGLPSECFASLNFALSFF